MVAAERKGFQTEELARRVELVRFVMLTGYRCNQRRRNEATDEHG